MINELNELKKQISGEKFTAMHALSHLVTLLASDAATEPNGLMLVETTPAEHAQILRAAYYWLQCCESSGAPESLVAKLDAIIESASQIPLVKDAAKSAVTRRDGKL